MKVTYRVCGTVLCGLALTPSPVAAQASLATSDNLPASPEDTVAGNGGSAVPDIIVTAQRRETSLQKTPVSVQVISADTLAKAQVVSEQDLRVNAPGLNIRATGGSNQINYVLRGESQDGFADNKPGVLPYVNEVQVLGGGGSTAFYDLQSIQVLRGPQGTLFGRSATGGAVLFTTNRPTEDLSGYLSGSLGNYAARKLEGAVSGAIVADVLMLRLAGIYQERHGFQRNLFDGGREGDVKRLGSRFSATLAVGAVRNELTFDYLKVSGSSMLGVPSGLITSVAANPPFVPGDLLYAGIADPTAAATGAFVLSLATGAPLPAATAFYNSYFADPRRTPTGLVGEVAAQQSRSPYVVNADARNSFRSRNIVLSNTTSLSLGRNITLKNIFGFVQSTQTNFYDFDGTPFNFASNGLRTPMTTPVGARYNLPSYSNELQLSGKVLADRLDFVLGAYFSKDQFKHRFQNAYYFDIFFGGAYQRIAYGTKTRTVAGYGEGTYKLTDSGLAVILGSRYTSERVESVTYPEATTRLALGDPAPQGLDYSLRDTFNYLSWKVGLQQQVNPDLLLYLSGARAYRAGGFNGVPVPLIGFADTAGVAYRKERVTAAEAGVKYAGYAGELPIRANLAAFYTWVRNNQRVAYTIVAGSPASLTANVPKTKIYGLEFDGYVRPADWLTVGMSSAYIRSKFGNDPVFLNGTAQFFDQVPDTPRFTGTLFGDLDVPLSASLALIGHVEYYLQSRSTTSPQSTNNLGTTIPAYGLVNLRGGIEGDDRRWSVVGNVKNLFDKIHFVGGLPNGAVYGLNTLVPGEPRTFTVEARYKF